MSTDKPKKEKKKRKSFREERQADFEKTQAEMIEEMVASQSDDKKEQERIALKKENLERHNKKKHLEKKRQKEQFHEKQRQQQDQFMEKKRQEQEFFDIQSARDTKD